MTATAKDIREWIERGQELGATHIIIAVDTWDHDNYPIYVNHVKGASGEMQAGGMTHGDVKKIYDGHSGSNMQQVDEVYSLTGKRSIESQLKKRRALYLD